MKKLLIISALFSFTTLFADVYATFEVKATKEASLAASAQGVISYIGVEVGAKVKKGQTLLSLNDKEERASLEATRSDYRFLQTQYERYQKSAEVFDKNTLERLRSELEKAKSLLAVNEERVAKMRLSAPFSGVISEKNVEIGDMASFGSKPLLRLVSSDVKLLLSFDSKFMNEVGIGDKFCYKIDGKNENKCATIYKIYPTVNSENKKLYAEANGVEIKIGGFGDGVVKTKARR